MEWVDASNVLVIAPAEAPAEVAKVAGAMSAVYSMDGFLHQPVWEFWDKRDQAWKEMFPHTQISLEQCLLGGGPRTTVEEGLGL